QQMQELILQENTYLVQSLGLGVDTPLLVDITAATAHVAPSQYEGQTAASLLDLAISKAPEKTQIDALEAAAKDQKWSDVFAFINSFSLGTDGNNSNGSSSSSSSGTGSFGGIGFSG